MEKSLESSIIRYNEIGRFLNLPIDDLFSGIQIKTDSLQLNHISKKKRQQNVSSILNVNVNA